MRALSQAGRALARHYEKLFFTTTDPRNLALDRILLFSFVLVYFGVYRPVDFTAYAEIPDLFQQVPAIPRRLGFAVASRATLYELQSLWVVSSIAACFGLFTRASMILATVLFTYLVVLTNSFGHPRIGHPLLVFAMVILCFSRAGQAWSLDALLRRSRRAAEPPENEPYVWPRTLIFLLPILTFWGAGIENVHTSGLGWGWSDTLEHTVRCGRYSFALSELQGQVGAFAVTYLPLRVFGAMALSLELTAPLALLGPRARAVMIGGYTSFILVIWLMIAEPMFEFAVLLGSGVDWIAIAALGGSLLARRTA
jgi:hypothetical protein